MTDRGLADEASAASRKPIRGSGIVGGRDEVGLHPVAGLENQRLAGGLSPEPRREPLPFVGGNVAGVGDEREHCLRSGRPHDR
jgi:hypothetical protein